MIRKTLKGLLWMLLSAALLVLLLATINRLPTLTHTGFARQYRDIEVAKRSLGHAPVLVPLYFPEGIAWPPSFILAQTRPYAALVMEFKKKDSDGTVLIVVQSSAPHGDAQLRRIALTEVRERTPIRLKGRPAILQVGACGNEAPCSGLAWQDNGFYYSVLLLSSPFELIKIGESMVH
jgi:hypothetical protein